MLTSKSKLCIVYSIEMVGSTIEPSIIKHRARKIHGEIKWGGYR